MTVVALLHTLVLLLTHAVHVFPMLAIGQISSHFLCSSVLQTVLCGAYDGNFCSDLSLHSRAIMCLAIRGDTGQLSMARVCRGRWACK